MNPRFVALVLVCAVAALLPTSSKVSSTSCNEPVSSADKESLRKVNQRYVAEWLAGRPDGVMSVFEQDAVIMPHHGGAPREGEQAIRRFWWPPDSPPFRLNVFTMTPDEINGTANLAFIRGKSSLAYSFENNGAWQDFSNQGTYLMILRKNHRGEWHIARFMWDDPVPQAP